MRHLQARRDLPGGGIVTLTRHGSVVVVKGVPAELCENCGEHYLTGTTALQVLNLADAAAERGREVVRFEG